MFVGGNEVKLVFFDFDGTLCAPNYLVDGVYTVGMPKARWEAFIEEKKEAIFEDCRPVTPVFAYAAKCKERGGRIIILTRTGSRTEDLAKQRFVEKWYPGLFDEYISVREDREKVEVIKDKAAANAVALSECELVEDTYAILLEAVSEGIAGKHVTNLIG